MEEESPETLAAYDQIAEWYDSVQRSGTIVQDASMGALTKLAGKVKGFKICDLACGQGVVARVFAKSGAQVIGVDISSKLLEIARAEESANPQSIEYLQMDAQSLSALPSSRFDGAYCNMALMDIADLLAVCKAIHRVLRPGGWFIFSIMHPCFQTSDSAWMNKDHNTARLVRAYFSEGRWHSKNSDGMRGRIGAVHRTISTYLNTFVASGFALETIAEPMIPREPEKWEPAYDEVPALLAARFRRL